GPAGAGRRRPGRIRRPGLDDPGGSARDCGQPARRRPRPRGRPAPARAPAGRGRAAAADPARDAADRARVVRRPGVTAADLLAELVAAASTNPDLAPGGAGEAAAAGIMARAMAAAGLEVDVWDAAPARPDVVGRL